MNKRFCLSAAAVLLAIVLVAACAPAAPSPGPAAPVNIVRFVFAPDPLLKYMQDTGIVARWENQCNMQLITISTWDEVTFFAGGHADIASTGDYELPFIAEETGEDFVIFGIYNVSRVPIWVRTDSPYQTIEDLEGKKIGVPGPLSSTMIWGVMLAETEGVDFRVGSDQFDLIVNEHSVNAELLRRGEIEAGIIVPEALIPEIREGTIRPLYGAGGGWEYYRDNFDPNRQHKGVPSNIFVARKEWFDANRDTAKCFLGMWQDGVDAWKANLEDIIRLYPEDHGVDPESETFEEDLATMAQWLTDHDWFVENVTLDQNWINTEVQLFDLMRRTGFMPQDMPNPVFEPLPID